MNVLHFMLLASRYENRARLLASEGQNMRAMRVLALAESIHHKANGDQQGRKLAMADAIFYRRAERKRVAHAV